MLAPRPLAALAGSLVASLACAPSPAPTAPVALAAPVASSPEAPATSPPVSASSLASVAPAPAPASALASSPPAYRLSQKELVGVWLISSASYEAARASTEAEMLRADGVYRWGTFDQKRKVFHPRKIETHSPGYVIRWEFDPGQGRLFIHNDGADESSLLLVDGPGRYRTESSQGNEAFRFFHVKVP